MNTNKCSPNPCGATFTCILAANSPSGFLCQCAYNDFRPQACTTTVTGCASNPCGSFPCISSGNSASGFLCQCAYNDFRPQACTTTAAPLTGCASNPCGSFPCINSANSATGYLCQCAFNDFRPTNCGSNNKKSLNFLELKFDSQYG